MGSFGERVQLGLYARRLTQVYAMGTNEKQEKLNRIAKEIITLSRSTLLVNLRFMDVALSLLEPYAIDTGTLMIDGRHIFYNPMHVLRCYKAAKELPVRSYLHMVMHCVQGDILFYCVQVAMSQNLRRCSHGNTSYCHIFCKHPSQGMKALPIKRPTFDPSFLLILRIGISHGRPSI